MYTFPVPVAVKALSPEWVDERQMFKKLDDIRRSEPDLPARPTVVRAPAAVPMRLPNGMTAQSSSMAAVIPAPPAIRPEQVTISRELISALKTRLAADKLSSWQFELGLSLHRAFQPDRYQFDRAAAADMIRSFIENRPEGVSPEVLSALKDLESNLRQIDISGKSFEAMSKSLTEILKSK